LIRSGDRSAKREPYEHNGDMHVEATLTGPVASLERHVSDLFDGLHQFADFGGLIVCVVAALPLSTVMALVQAPLDPELVFAELESVRSST